MKDRTFIGYKPASGPTDMPRRPPSSLRRASMGRLRIKLADARRLARDPNARKEVREFAEQAVRRIVAEIKRREQGEA